MKIRLNGQTVNLAKEAVLGTGGEAVVIKYSERLAVKLYHQPSPARAAKLTAMLNQTLNLPEAVIYPLAGVQAEHGSELIGFAMPVVPARMQPLVSLFNKSFRAQAGINAGQVTALFLKIHPIVEALHQAGLVIGDFNDLNILFEGSQPVFIDVDSYQFTTYPCPVATEDYLAPELYDADLTVGPGFRPQHDWYSYAVLLFRALLLVHPYGGTHRQIHQLTGRALHRLSVLDPSVIYPKVALNPALLDDDLAQLFWQIFSEGKRGVFPVQTLQDYAGGLTECPTCHNWFPVRRKVCPVCQGFKLAVSLPLPKQGLRIQRLLATDGPLLACRVNGTGWLALAHEGDLVVLYRQSKDRPFVRQELFRWQAGSRYRFMDDYLVVNPADSPNLLILKLDKDGVTPFTRATSGQFEGQAVFATTGRHLYRTAGGSLLRGEILYGQLVERPLMSVLDQQTWFQASDSGQTEQLCGFERVFHQYRWFGYDRQGRSELAIPPVALDEALVNYSSLPGLVIRHTRQTGAAQVRLELLGPAPLAIRRPDTTEIGYGGGLFAQGIALWPTNNGLLKEHLEANGQVYLPETASFVTAATRLHNFGTGLLAENETELWQIGLNT